MSSPPLGSLSAGGASADMIAGYWHVRQESLGFKKASIVVVGGRMYIGSERGECTSSPYVTSTGICSHDR
jgi:hypothetical protein